MSRPDSTGVETTGDESQNETDPSFFEDPKRLLQTAAAVIVLIAAIYFLFPKLVGVDDGFRRLRDGDTLWIAIAVGFSVVMFVSYAGLFKGVVADHDLRLRWSESYQITMAGLAATRLFSAGGAGGIILTYWALRKAGMERTQSAARMVAFLVLLYSVYLFTLVINGILLRVGVFAGPAPAGLTVIPASISGGVILLLLLVSLVPGDFQRRLASSSPEHWAGRLAVRLATVPATLSTGIRMAIGTLRSRSGLNAIAGAIGFWGANIAILWASFEAYHLDVAGAVIVQGFFVGMVANLLPFAPGGVGAVDAGMIGTFVLFGLPSGPVFAAVLCYRVIAFWLPLPPGIIAFFQLRRTVRRWEVERPFIPVGGEAEPVTS